MKQKHPFFDFFNKDRPHVDPNSSRWPPEWKIIQWKEYLRYPRIALPEPGLLKTPLGRAIAKRRSSREFTEKSLSLSDLSALLYYSCGITHVSDNLNNSRRAHPSGGALFSLETYIIVFRGQDQVKIGIYHYNALRHALEKLPAKVDEIETLKAAFFDLWVANASMVLLFSYIEDRNKPKYGNLAYKLALLEAGHIGQNVYLSSSALGINVCATAGFDAETLHAALDFDGISEVIIYALALGK